jgi:hypothetical protein
VRSTDHISEANVCAKGAAMYIRSRDGYDMIHCATNARLGVCWVLVLALRGARHGALRSLNESQSFGPRQGFPMHSYDRFMSHR